MKYCPNCGTLLNEGDNVCSNCGYILVLNDKDSDHSKGNSAKYDAIPPSQSHPSEYEYSSTNDSGNPWWAVLGFFIPLVGLILFLIWRTTQPNNAKSSGFGALISVVWGICIGIVSTIAAMIAAI